MPQLVSGAKEWPVYRRELFAEIISLSQNSGLDISRISVSLVGLTPSYYSFKIRGANKSLS